MRGSRKFYQRWSKFDNVFFFFFFFFVDERRKDQILLLAGHYGLASETPFQILWRADDGPTFTGLVAL